MNVYGTDGVSQKNEGEDSGAGLFPWYVNGVVAFICAAVIILLAVLGPLGLGYIEYRSSESGVWQLEGQDLTDLVLIAPLLIIGGTLAFMRRPLAKYFLILTPVTLIYAGIIEGIGQEWSSAIYDGNVEHYFWIFLIMIIGGLFLLISTLSMFTKDDAPEFDPKQLRIFVAVIGLALLMFALMWIGQVMDVLAEGDLSDGSYTAAPTAFWVVKYLDLGFTIPVGFISLFMLMARPKQAYHLVLLFYGFFVTTGTAVNMMALVMFMNDDPGVGQMGAGILIFPLLALMAYIGLYYLLKDKIHGDRRMIGKEAPSGE